MDINFEYYKIFYHVAHKLSFTEAAENLFISQSAVSQAIKKLEEKLGSSLFIRKGKKLLLTHEGEMLYKHIKPAYSMIKTVEDQFTGIAESEGGEISLGCGDTVCKYLLIEQLRRFVSKYPEIHLKVFNRTSNQIINLLKNGAIDIGIISLPCKDTSIETYPFLEVEDIFVHNGKYKELEGKEIELKTLLEYPLLLLDKKSSTTKNLEKYFHEKGLKLSAEIEFENVDILVEFALIGMGVAYVLRQSAENHIISGELKKIETAEPLPKRSLGIAKMKGLLPSKPVMRFLEILT